MGICFVTVVLVIWIRGGFDPPPPRATSMHSPHRADTPWPAQSVRDNPAESTSHRSKSAMTFQCPGIVDPPVKPVDCATTDDDDEIVGLEINGMHRAYCLSE